jgi:hypothetical protein
MGIELAQDIDLGLVEFQDILGQALEQVTVGKGDERHGNGAQIYDQPWFSIANASGNGFLTGQAIKKTMEAASMLGKPGYSGERFERELLGAIAYISFAIMHNRSMDEKATYQSS